MAMSFGGVSKAKVATIIVAADGSGDTTDIQTGINLLPTGGGSVWIKEGIYNISTKIDLDKSNVGLIGSGRASILNISTGNGLSIGDITNCSIENLSFTGSSDAALIAASTGVPKEIIIKHCYFYDSTAEGLDIRTGHFYITGNYFSNVGDVTAINHSISLNTSDSLITGNIIVDAPQIGIVLGSASTQAVTANNVVINSGNVGIQITSDNTVITGNVCSGNALPGIYLNGADKSVVNGNICKNNVRDGIQVFSSNDVMINGNICIGNDSEDTASYDGIQIYYNSDNCMVVGNRCSENDRYEINVRNNTCNKTLVHGNHCIGTDHEGTINDAGTGTVSSDNVEV